MAIDRRQGSDFGLSVDCISKEALKVVKVLQKAGHQSYIVGGGVRDLLLGRKPKDFDIATSAHPEKIRRLFKRCRLVGKRFRLAHVFDNRQMLEVATFRAGNSDKEQKNLSVQKWCLVSDNKYGTLEEDLVRRDFTINAMYYDPFSDALICHPDAISDLENKCLRMIGDPLRRYREDPVRMLRAVRLAAKLDLNLEHETEEQIIPNRLLLENIPHARLFEESKKSFCCGASCDFFQKLEQFQLFALLFPQTADTMKNHPKAKAFKHFLKLLFSATDARVALSEPVMPAFIIAGLWWLAIYIRMEKQSANRKNLVKIREKKIDEVAMIQRSRIAIPRYILHIIYDIYNLQPYFTSCYKKDIDYLIQTRRFRAAYGFFCLLSKAELADLNDCKWWEEFQQADKKQRNAMIENRTKKHSEHNHSKQEKRGSQC